MPTFKNFTKSKLTRIPYYLNAYICVDKLEIRILLLKMYRVRHIMSCLLLLSICLCNYVKAQTPPQMEAFNTYISFLNESVHGLTVAHILFVNYNKDLNKYVDLDSKKINEFMDNDQVGVSIFDNPDYKASGNTLSPLKLSKLAEEKSAVLDKNLASRLNAIVFDIVAVLNNLDNQRFEIEKFIANNDLEDKENIYKCYSLLEEVVSNFNRYNENHKKLVTTIKGSIPYKARPLGFILDEVHKVSTEILDNLRLNRPIKYSVQLKRLRRAIEKSRQKDFGFNDMQRTLYEEVILQVGDMASFIDKQSRSKTLPPSYTLYGKRYYMHNNILLSYFNSISPGFVTKINELNASRTNIELKYDDRPLLYKVTYPQKMAEIQSIATKQRVNKNGIDLPITADVKKVEKPKTNYIEFEFFDPDLLDRDSISVSFNDEWLLDNYMLQFEPKKFIIEIDPNSSNSINIFAKNIGIISPNTVGFKYRINGKGAKIYQRLLLQPNSG